VSFEEVASFAHTEPDALLAVISTAVHRLGAGAPRPRA
jgi:hypothetical protein